MRLLLFHNPGCSRRREPELIEPRLTLTATPTFALLPEVADRALHSLERTVSNATQAPLFLARFSPKLRPFSAIFRPFSPSRRQEAGQRKGTAGKRRKTGAKRPRNSGLGGVGIPGA